VGAQIVIWTFYDQVVKVEKGWVEREFMKQCCQMSKYPTGYLQKELEREKERYTFIYDL
jgi:hypothetical protein